MTIREYRYGEHKSSFIGLRVVVRVGQDYRQKYFNFRKANTNEDLDALRKEAKELNGIWNMERILIQDKKNKDSKERRRSSSAFTTGVSGVKMKFTHTFKPRNPKKKYYTPYFVITGSTDGIRYAKTYNIIRYGYDMAWFKAIEFYAEQKGMSSYSHLLKRKPPVEQFYIIHKYQESMGHNIPLARMPAELDQDVIKPK